MKKIGHGKREAPPDMARRRLVQAGASMGVLALSSVAPLPAFSAEPASRHRVLKGNNPMFAYVGSRTTRERNARGDGISVYQVDTQTGALTLVQLVKDLVNPSFLALSANGERLYTVHGDLSDISAFKVDKASGSLTFLNKQSTEGKNPVHLAIDPSGRYVVVSNHIGSSLAVLPIAADGSLEPLTQLVHLEGPIGPHRVEQKQSKPHFNPFDPSGRFVIVPDKGLDRTFSFRFENGQLTPANPPFVASREGAGPRHIAFHPQGHYAWVVNELDSTVTTYRYDAANGSLTPLQVVSSVPDTYTGNSRASEIEVDRSGRFVYASNRGDDSIAVYRVDPANGHLHLVNAVPSQGKTPRFFTTTPDGHFMYALNEDSDTIVAFSVDAHAGGLTPTGFVAQSGSPVCMVFSQHQA
ncbi:lactonase family protein [Paraburkholderia sp. JHI869]|uniref:lactonase family protein n=1 Tax=Paraburkholderia sp. JHI869 TaxID=3112959 RepID=UPI003182AF77